MCEGSAEGLGKSTEGFAEGKATVGLISWKLLGVFGRQAGRKGQEARRPLGGWALAPRGFWRLGSVAGERRAGGSGAPSCFPLPVFLSVAPISSQVPHAREGSSLPREAPSLAQTARAGPGWR